MKLKCIKCQKKTPVWQGQHIERRVSRREKRKVFICDRCSSSKGKK